MSGTITEDRRNQLVQMLLHEGSIKVGDAAKQFQVSTETIRKDIIFLEQEGIAKKSHGGATLATDMMELSTNLKRGQNKDAKERIAAYALGMIKEGDVLILDSGTSCAELARYLALRKGLTIFTNSLLIMNTLVQTENQVYVFGGQLNNNSYGLFGGWGAEQVRRIHADICFLGSDGFQGQNGPATSQFEEAEFKHQLVQVSDRSVLLADGSKFKRRTLFNFCSWEQLDTLITDDSASAEEIEKLRRKTNVIVV